jgi:hypothetical protein
LIELSLVLDAWQFEAVDFFILPKQGVAGRAKYRVPKHTAEVTAVFADTTCVLAGHNLMQPKSLSAHGRGQKYQQTNSLCSTLHEVASNLLPPTQAAILNHKPFMPNRLWAARLPKSIPARLPYVTLAST